MRYLSNFSEYAVAGLLFLCGLAAVIIALMDFLGWNISSFTSKAPIDLILLTVGLLATALGLERVVRFRRYDLLFERLELLLSTSKGGQYLIGHDETYRTINRLCRKADTRIRALIHLASPQYSAPNEWPVTVAKRLKEAQDEGRPARLDAVIALSFENVPPDFEQVIVERRKIYKRFKAESLANPYLLNVNNVLGVDIFIVDSDHAVIAFRSPAGQRMVISALLFENQPDIVSDIVEWFDHFILDPAIPFDKWGQEDKSRNTLRKSE